jgi:hypothetical protein
MRRLHDPVPIACAFLSRHREARRFAMACFACHDRGGESSCDAAPVHSGHFDGG